MGFVEPWPAPGSFLKLPLTRTEQLPSLRHAPRLRNPYLEGLFPTLPGPGHRVAEQNGQCTPGRRAQYLGADEAASGETIR
jgi:hypothetical protein